MSDAAFKPGRRLMLVGTFGGPLGEALTLCGTHLRFAVLFSAIVNLAYLAPTLYMLQVYDRVVPSGSQPTLVFLTLALAAALFLLTYLDRMRGRILLALASAARGAPIRLNQMTRDFDTVRMAITGPAILAVFDAPWIPIYIIVCFMVHPLIGAIALGGAIVLCLLAVLNERSTWGLNRRAAAAAGSGAAAEGRAGTRSSAQQRLYFLPEPQGQA